MIRKTKKNKKTKKNIKTTNGSFGRSGNRNGYGNGYIFTDRQKKFKRKTKTMSGGSHEIIEFDDKIKAPPNCDNSETMPTDINRYINKQQYFINPSIYCYAITAIQILRNIIDVKDYIEILNSINLPLSEKTLSNRPIKSDKINFCYESLNTKKFAISDAKKYKIIYETLLTILNSNDKDISANLQKIAKILFPDDFKTTHQDIAEFIDGLNLVGIKEIESYSGKEFYDKDKNFIKKIKIQDPQIIIIIPIKDDKKEKQTFDNLQQLFLNYQKGNILDSKNNYKSDGVEYNNAIELPIIYVKNENKYLLLQLKLTQHEQTTVKRTKINITFTNLNDFLCIRSYDKTDLNDDETKQYVKGTATNYELISIACHAGGPNSGHYINLSKQNLNGEIKWVYYNDSGNSSYNTKILTDNTKLTDIKQGENKIYYLKELDDINLLNQEVYTPYLFLYKRITSDSLKPPPEDPPEDPPETENPYPPDNSEGCKINGAKYNVCNGKYVANKYNLYNLMEVLKKEKNELNPNYNSNFFALLLIDRKYSFILDMINEINEKYKYKGKTVKDILDSPDFK